MTSNLSALDALIAAKLPAVAVTLRPPASAKHLAKLARLFGGALPDDVRAWFRWHDGQAGSASLIPSTNWRALSIDGVIAAAKVVAHDEGIPLFENGSGDHLVWRRGVLVTYFHDDDDRPRAYASLAAVVAAMTKGYTKLKPPKGIAPPPSAVAWATQKTAPKLAELARALPGDAYAHAATYPFGKRVEIFVNLRPDAWLCASGTNLADALAEWSKLATRPPAPKSGYYKSSSDVASSLAEYPTARKKLKR